MVFSSITFIYMFLPLCLLIYYIVPAVAKNTILLIFSLLFYSLGEPKLFLVILACIILVYFGGRILEKNDKTCIFIILIILCLLPLVYFKYTNFFISNINNIFQLNISILKIVLPLGISFYTFQMISYLADIRRKEITAEKNILKLALYVCFFPQLVAGPIVTYKDFSPQLDDRKTNTEQFSDGILYFVTGLGKKVLIANQLGELCSLYNHETATVLFTWIYAISYSLQIYFDFSGYSTMAIGLGKMFGFNLPENFNYPFISSSIKEFWTRWHITLSSFFKNYVYIPLGGSRCTTPRYIFNLFFVWFLTGFWHGADWQFIFWGLFFFICLCIEKFIIKGRINKCIGHIGTTLAILISFLIFSSENISDMFFKLKSLFYGVLTSDSTVFNLTNYGFLLLVGFIGSLPLINIFYKKHIRDKKISAIVEPVYIAILLILSTAYLIDGSFNPFLYFRF